jgi:hypothetical protein
MCIVTTDGPTCKCPTGQLGNPFAGGSCTIDQCSAQRPCQSPQICINGRCKHKCDGVVCGVGAQCDGNTGRCVCEPFFVGNPDYICMPPVSKPTCNPLCGANAHCEYGSSGSVCVCDPGSYGNPYEGCGPQEKRKCKPSTCGKGAECREGFNVLECVCPPGFNGNPYIGCHDIDECSSQVCGEHAICINTPGSYDCRCREGYAGNPFEMCSAFERGFCSDQENCKCGKDIQCPGGFKCEQGVCKDLCEKVKCGPRAACNAGTCVCPSGFDGNPNDQKEGCTMLGQCQTDLDCRDSEICFRNLRGIRKCVDGCSKLQCGPNSLCVTNSHRSACVCIEGYKGNPVDLNKGCTTEGKISIPEGCNAVACGRNEICKIGNEGPVCQCQDSYLWNPESSACEKPSVPQCTSSIDCKQNEACKADVLGVLKCVPVCSEINCPAFSVCVARNHEGSCQCLPGYKGNPNDRNGCAPDRKNQCSSNAECSESEMCIRQQGISKCVSSCDSIRCGPNAACITNNHIAKCQCPPGNFVGDPNDFNEGCQQVNCVYNIDCPPTQYCNRLDNKCYDVCMHDSCGDNAVCIAEDHKTACQCPVGYKPNPIADVECVAIESCNENICHPTAICEATTSGPICKCPPNYIGDPYKIGCRMQIEGDCPRGNIDCPKDSVCNNGKCTNPCEEACGVNALCKIIDRKAVCSCPQRFEPISGTAREGCYRLISDCSSEIDCDGGICQNNQCKYVCRQSGDCSTGERCVNNACVVPCSGHGQCRKDQACVGGACVLGCRSNRDCSSEQACVNNKCQNPCFGKGICGPNAECSTKNHKTSCQCPPAFEPNPTPDQGCVRVPNSCGTSKDCGKNLMCIVGKCNLPCENNDVCAIGERCFNNMCSKVCYTNNNCLPGEICNGGGICVPGCASDVDCPHTEICLQSKCKCAKGYINTPQGCIDIDECTDKVCHSTAICENVPGSFKCSCPSNSVGDPYGDGCRKPSECTKNLDCADNLACKSGKCVDPCALKKCGNLAQCSVNDHVAECHCPSGHLGNPIDTRVGCFRVECLGDDECPKDRACDLAKNKCTNSCDSISCGKGSCEVENHYPVCSCVNGYALVNDKCEDIDECQQNPCHETAICKNTPGNFICSCRDGLVGDPVVGGCRKPGECFTDNDCPDAAVCENAKCRNPCEAPNICGKNAICRAVGHTATCRCPSNAKGDPKVSCDIIECSDDNECDLQKSCINSKCVNPCSLQNACGQNAICSTDNHVGICSCQPGTTGNPLLGCTQIQYCSSDNQCPSSTKCNNGICSTICSSARDCLSDQLCIKSICQPTCYSNTTCPDFQFCQNNICVQEPKCFKDDDCSIGEYCAIDSNGRSECKDVCVGRFLCGRNSECTARNHVGECECKEGFYADGKVCKKIECQTDNDCSNDKRCDNHMCKLVCLMSSTCGENALCTSENHQQVCQCQPGHTGDPKVSCKVIDYCESSPCATGATCRNNRGSYKCLCKQGLVGDPYNYGCQKPEECKINNDCPKAAKCVSENGSNKCKDVCEGVRCGPNADCIPKDHAAQCECRFAYEGNPKDRTNGCRPKANPCSTNSECPQDSYCNGVVCKPACMNNKECGSKESCFSGQCLNLCDLPQACGMNAECTTRNHEKSCTCPAGFTGSPDTECVRIPIACSSNADCSNGKSCTDTMCLPTCQQDQECALNEKCINNNCMLTCRVDNDCFLGHICLRNKCVFGCHSDEDCSGSESCFDNRCRNPCEENPCGPNALCSVINQRASCTCAPGMVPSPSAKVACIRSPALPCSENRDCVEGSACFNDFCRPVCANDAGCLNNERCDRGACKPLCRKDDDCRNGEICQGQMCSAGCRSNSGCAVNFACVDQHCVDPCQNPTACGSNAACVAENHQPKCSCEAPLVGNPTISCRLPLLTCEKHADCSKGQTCYGNECRASCRNDQNCLSDEKCIRGTCRAVCSKDSQCGNEFICENRICQIGCRTDNTCPKTQSCINKQCTDPCSILGQCGSCAECSVHNHGIQCSCKKGMTGNPMIGCSAPLEFCNENCQCDGSKRYCLSKCKSSNDCSCGQECLQEFCRSKCNPGNCAPGQLCKDNVCVEGCQTKSDCGNDMDCQNNKCKDPCEGAQCGKNAICRSANHRALCLCPDGFTGEPTVKCSKVECQRNEDCDLDKRCVDGSCRNPCLERGVCGNNAQCRVENRQAICSCLIGFAGDPKVQCLEPRVVTCQRDTCGINSYCIDSAKGPECKCQTGCIGDPIRGCTCDDQQHLTSACSTQKCGTNAICKMNRNGKNPSCQCPPLYPNGDPNIECNLFNHFSTHN